MKSITFILTIAVMGLLMGYGYYCFLGCTSNCMITSSPVKSTLYGGLLGVLLGFSFIMEKQK